MEAQVHMDQCSLVSEAALLPVVFSNEAATIVGTIMGVETQCATTSHFNLTFERLMEFGILMSDGSLDPEKHSSATFKENFSRNSVCTVREESDIVSLLELRASGTKVDANVAKLGFQCSHSIEVLDILGVFGLVERIRFQSRQKRKFLWDTLKSSIPSISLPWMAISDFNAILYSSDKKGGHSSGRRFFFLVTLLIRLNYKIWGLRVSLLLSIEVFLRGLIELLAMMIG
ncbi:hypothetical protein PVK06_048922 [Gossypium arboreum]|uniref:Uncharacterized protein n=1 Tax=Gossypium arboreum TaxID=29729 RepID=A0ABR0MHB6_GOSAR|nr:hypothetical protein PVK06_048922 [Gossypium arboreum]